MINHKKHYKQTFLYKGKEYQYKIQAQCLKKFERETGLVCDRANSRTKDGTLKLLYYCTCWKGIAPTMETFLNDCRNGKVSFRPGAREHGTIGIYKLFLKKISEYKRSGDL